MGSTFVRSHALPVDRRPSAEQIAELVESLPAQPLHVAAVLTGLREPAGPWGKGRVADTTDVFDAVAIIGQAAGVELTLRSAVQVPWHPGRCGEILAGDIVVGWAGELHPAVLEKLHLTAAFAGSGDRSRRDPGEQCPCVAADLAVSAWSCRTSRWSSMPTWPPRTSAPHSRPGPVNCSRASPLRRLHRRAGGRGQASRSPSRSASGRPTAPHRGRGHSRPGRRPGSGDVGGGCADARLTVSRADPTLHTEAIPVSSAR